MALSRWPRILEASKNGWNIAVLSTTQLQVCYHVAYLSTGEPDWNAPQNSILVGNFTHRMAQGCETSRCHGKRKANIWLNVWKGGYLILGLPGKRYRVDILHMNAFFRAFLVFWPPIDKCFECRQTRKQLRFHTIFFVGSWISSDSCCLHRTEPGLVRPSVLEGP